MIEITLTNVSTLAREHGFARRTVQAAALKFGCKRNGDRPNSAYLITEDKAALIVAWLTAPRAGRGRRAAQKGDCQFTWGDECNNPNCFTHNRLFARD